MPSEEIELHLLFKDEETDDDQATSIAAVTNVLPSYIEHIANKKLVLYRGKIHYGGKAGESLWTHVMNLVFVIGKLRGKFLPRVGTVSTRYQVPSRLTSGNSPAELTI
jgi:hypothetical protein